MRARSLARALLVAAFATAVLCIAAATASARNAPSGGTTQINPAGLGGDEGQGRQLAPALAEAGGQPVNRPRPGFKNGKFPKNPLDAASISSAAVQGSTTAVSFDGLFFRQQRLANGGNQFSVEPPDQGLCVGNGHVLETINTVLRVFDTSGSPQTGVQDLNTFLGYPAQFDRTAGVIGPFVTDPSCIYDRQLGRWLHLDLTLEVTPDAGDFTGPNHLDLAVSNTNDPTGTWTLYRIPVQDDGTDGTPNHNCDTGPDASKPGVTNPNACIGDYPHIGADANGIYLSTNEYSLFGNNYNGSQIYAIGKTQLSGVTLPGSLSFTQIENTSVDGSPGFTVWPANADPGQYETAKNGTEYFVSTIGGDGSESGNPTGTARRIAIWALTNTASLNTGSPAVSLSSRLINSETYVFPPRAEQKVGDFPLGQCINDTTGIFFGFDCWQLFFASEPAHNEVEGQVDMNDGRIQQVWLANGRLYTTTDTAVQINGDLKAGVAWFFIDPKINGAGKIEGKIAKQGYLGVANNNLGYPAMAVLPSGKGVATYTLAGGDHYPSAAYSLVNSNGVENVVHVASEGVGPQDGFTEYRAFLNDPVNDQIRPRWGDYGAVVTDGNDLWFASEYIAQTCDLNTYLFGGPIGSCGGTRASLGNWATRVSKITP
jgi:hypothetical protein